MYVNTYVLLSLILKLTLETKKELYFSFQWLEIVQAQNSVGNIQKFLTLYITWKLKDIQIIRQISTEFR